MGYAYRLSGDEKFMDIGTAALHEGWKGSPGGCKGLAQATMSPPHFMYDLHDFERNLLHLAGPGEKLVLLLDTEDRDFRATVYQRGAGGTATIIAPDGKEVAQAKLDRDEPEHTFEVAADGLVGIYKVGIHAEPGSVWSVSSDLGKMLVAESPNGPYSAPVKGQTFVYGRPIPHAGGNKVLRIGDAPEITFDGSRSLDYNGKIADYQWDFGDGQKASGVKVTHRYATSGAFNAALTVKDNEGLTDTAIVRVVVPTLPDLGIGDLDKRTRVIIEAESFAGQGNGEVRVMDKFAASGRALSYWEGPGQWVEWKFSAPKDDDYLILLRYAAAKDAVRQLQVDGAAPQAVPLPATGGFAGDRDDWRWLAVSDGAGKPISIRLSRGEHRLRLTQAESGLALDCIVLLSANRDN
jgi:hypothetical protein